MNSLAGIAELKLSLPFVPTIPLYFLPPHSGPFLFLHVPLIGISPGAHAQCPWSTCSLWFTPKMQMERGEPRLVMVLNMGKFCPPLLTRRHLAESDISSCLYWGKEEWVYSWHVLGRCQGCPWTSPQYRIVPTTKHYLVPSVNSAELRSVL